jgi:hypothetical protein
MDYKGGHYAYNMSGQTADCQAALREQRRRDFFLSGHRLGDLRRYITQYNVDMFPTGPHPNADWGPYGRQRASCRTTTSVSATRRTGSRTRS